ncbi:UDP-N-acetylmuramoyl-L-alanyl-D-glutamate--2,6-diaminopimelate ligase [Aeromicrobium terrae]|uniref:UDP-N-acetylmuramoyl-L-alanyl-D-glutamate--2, 6-diaminopimelate ligase n=1 Tax=Aeromicrobium terrae TaxID=2498846 RepID=UPI001C9C446B|nr:UDP-N-acetylmuramoyl-L-alanyl-D-glutamate--2,6-diaminopimelate ligase [Aeromicrobium terrae]
MVEVMRVRPEAPPRRALADVADHLGISPSGAAEVTGIALNTGLVVPGDLYAALPGARSHGADHVAAAVEAGAVAVLTDADGAQRVDTDLPVLVVDEPRSRLAELSAWFYDHPATSMTTFGITGTQGKTTSTYLAEAALAGHRSAVVGTIGTRIAGVPADSALTTPEAPALQALFAVMREERVEACAMEVSSHAMVQGRVDGVVFDVAAFLNLGRDHLDFHGDMEEYFLAKAALFTPEHARRGVVNVDDPYGRRLLDLTPLDVVTFSSEGAAADWRAANVRPHRLGTELEVLGPNGLELELSVPLPGVFNVSNALAVVAGLATAGFDATALAAGIAGSTGVPGRMERVEAGQEFTAIVDYAHKPDAVVAVLSALRPVTPGRLVIVIGAGGDRDQGKRPIMGAAAAEHADLVVVTDDNPRTEDAALIRAEVLRGAADGPGAAIEVAGRREAIAHAVALAHRGDTVVVAGKGHEQGQEVDGVVHPFDDKAVLRELIEEHA